MMTGLDDVNSNNDLDATPLQYQVAGHSYVPNKTAGMSIFKRKYGQLYTLSEAWSGMNWTDRMAAQGAFGTDF